MGSLILNGEAYGGGGGADLPKNAVLCQKTKEVPEARLNADILGGEITASNVKGINIYVSEEGKLHFVDATGADTELPFSGGSGIVSGEFISSPNADGIIEIDLGFRPKRVECWFSFNGMTDISLRNQMVAYYDEELSTTQSIWNLHPAEGTIYYLNLGEHPGETGISHITDTGFKFRAHGGNTVNTKVRYLAY